MNPVLQYLIVGAGVAGLAAIEAIRSVDRQGEITLVSDDPFGYYSRPGLAYYLTGELDEASLYPFKKADYQSLRLKAVQARVETILPEKRRAILSNGSALPYDRLLIATGSLAAPVKNPGADLRGVVKIDSLTDAREILQHARKARTAVVVGGGITALELVEGLRAQGLKVNFFLRGDRYWSNVLDEPESQIILQALEEEGVHIHKNTELEVIDGKNGRVSAVRTKDGREIRCEIVAYAIGVLPRLDLAHTAGLTVERGIQVDEFMRSSDPFIYAAGDVAQVYDPFSERYVVDTLWSTAKQQGRAAGLNMAGCTTPYTKSAPFNVTRLAGLTTTIIGTVGSGSDPSLVGIARGDSETWRLLPDALVAEDNFEVNRLRVLIGEDRLLGAVVMGDQSLSRPLQELIANKVDIRPIRDVLLKTKKPGEVLLAYWMDLEKSAGQTHDNRSHHSP